MINDERGFLAKALAEMTDAEVAEIKAAVKDREAPAVSRRHKTRMNRVFRERVGGTFLPYPEVDSFYERVRSAIVVKLRLNDVTDRYRVQKREI